MTMYMLKSERACMGFGQQEALASDWLKPHLAEHGYHECRHTHGLFKHETRPVMFSLVVDDFGVQYVGARKCTAPPKMHTIKVQMHP